MDLVRTRNLPALLFGFALLLVASLSSAACNERAARAPESTPVAIAAPSATATQPRMIDDRPLLEAHRKAREAREAEEWAGRESAFLSVLTKSSWASVWVDGRLVSQETPVHELRLASGTHVVRLVNPAAKFSEEITIDMRSGDKVKLVGDVRAGVITKTSH